jgi:two-component system response regulator PilR (NtrC family)
LARILVVDDETSMQEFLQILLQRDGHEVSACGSASEALVALESDDWDLVISDIRMPGMSGLELLDQIHRLAIETTVILITAHGTTESAVEAMKHGAYDYLTKPCSVDEIRLVVEKALEKRDLSAENQRLRQQLRAESAFPTIVGKSSRMQEIFALVRQVAPTRANILITGESGTGKELIARAIHNLSDRRDAPFVAVNCGAIPVNLLESELFGHVKGSFTGASANKPGLFEVANGGTLFLDEIGEMEVGLQVKVLRAIQHRTFQRVGGTSEIHVDVRILCSTNRRLDVEVREGRFREDLFYRLNVIEIELPPLRDRPEDLPQLVQHFAEKYSVELGKDVREIDSGVHVSGQRSRAREPGGARGHARARQPNHSRLSPGDGSPARGAHALDAHPGGGRRPRRAAGRVRDLAHPGGAAADGRSEEARRAAARRDVPLAPLPAGEAPARRWNRLVASESVTKLVTRARAERHLVTPDTFANDAAGGAEPRGGAGSWPTRCAFSRRQRAPGTAIALSPDRQAVVTRSSRGAEQRFSALSKETNDASQLEEA